MRHKNKTKRVLCVLLCAAALLTGCSNSSSNTESSDTSKYDSYITYHIDDDMSNEDFEKLGGENGQLLKRFKNCLSTNDYEQETIKYKIQSDSDDRTVKICFNNDLNVTEDVLRLTAEKNLVEMREGTKPDGELVLGNEQIENALAVIDGNSDNESEDTREQVLINLKLNDDGTKKLEKATEKLTENNSTLTITTWVDGKTINSATVHETLHNAENLSLHGLDKDYNAAKRIAYQLRSEYMPYKVSVTECKVSPSQKYNTSSDNS